MSQISNRRSDMIAAMNTISDDRVPVIVCDECHEVIEDVTMAMAVMPASEGLYGVIQQVLHIHKANCFAFFPRFLSFFNKFLIFSNFVINILLTKQWRTQFGERILEGAEAIVFAEADPAIPRQNE